MNEDYTNKDLLLLLIIIVEIHLKVTIESTQATSLTVFSLTFILSLNRRNTIV